MIETVKPTITSVLSAEGYVGKNGIIYNNSDTGVSIKVEDKDSGIYSVKASVNNKELVNVSYRIRKRLRKAMRSTRRMLSLMQTPTAMIW